ncbi:hypothetical protein M3148_08925 [Georgenia satyanarayanai]|uniref:hypothetical protein n=1 Tax=Georgenia satyanarayanai TaxID=860221 RepID=UPI00203EF839|nr:hypothetical protein [Georgenia satyanarayanai]MCM3661112.1 hypothetical protein [Georgenia satyanarayanai]
MATMISPDGGSTVWRSATYTLKVKDSKDDNKSVYGYANNTNNRLNNLSGVGTTVQKTYGFKITAVQACTDIPLASDPCSDWGL